MNVCGRQHPWISTLLTRGVLEFLQLEFLPNLVSVFYGRNVSVKFDNQFESFSCQHCETFAV